MLYQRNPSAAANIAAARADKLSAPPPYGEALAREIAQQIEGEVRFDPGSRALYDAAANWLVYGFPAIAGATAAVLIIAGIRMLSRR